MRRASALPRWLGALALAILAAGAATAEAPRTVTVLAWADAFDPALLDAFERQSGVRVLVDPLAPGATLVDALRSGHVDIVMLSADQLPAAVQADLLAPLATAVPGDGGADPVLTTRLAEHDAGGPHAIPFAWFGTTLLARRDKLRDRRLAPDPGDGWAMLFRPDDLRRLSDCGVAVADDSRDFLGAALAAHDPGAPDAAAMRRALARMEAVRKLVRRLPLGEVVDGLATGTLCLGLLPAPFAWQATDRAASAGITLDPVSPGVGGRLFIDALALVKAAPNPVEARRLLAFLIRPDSAVRNAAFAHLSSAILGSSGIERDVDADPGATVLVPMHDAALNRALDVFNEPRR